MIDLLYAHQQLIITFQTRSTHLKKDLHTHSSVNKLIIIARAFFIYLSVLTYQWQSYSYTYKTLDFDLCILSYFL